MTTVKRTPLSAVLLAALIANGLLLVMPQESLAQDTVEEKVSVSQDENESANSEARPTELGTVTVTAQKRVQSEQDVAMSIGVIETRKMSGEGIFGMADYFSQVPGLSFVQSPMSSNIVMRGIATDSGIGIRPTSAIVIDGVPFGSSINTGTIPDLDPSSLQRIEVLRGPQGTLYGASSMGGLVKYVLVDPDTSGTYGRMQIGVSNVAHGGTGYNTRGAINLGLSDSFALRGSVFKRQDAYFIKDKGSNDNNGSEVRGGRVAAIWHVGDATTIRASALYQDTTKGASAVVDTDPNLQPIYGQYLHDRINGGDNFEGRVRLYTLKVNQDLGWATLDSITGYAEHRRKANQDVGYTVIGELAPMFSEILGLDATNPSALIDNRYGVDRLTQEFRLSSAGQQKLSWQTGVFYSNEDLSSTQNFYIAEKDNGIIYSGHPLLVSEGNGSYSEKAVYGDITYRFTSKFDIQVGARYARNKLEISSHSGGLLQDPLDTADVYEDSATTYMISPRYHFSDNVMGYFRAASGYRAGGSNGYLVENIPRSYGSDSLWSYELGLKTTLLNRTLDLDAALFYIDWADMQISQVEPTLGSSYTTNAGKAVSQGLELSVAWLPAVDWRFSASYAFTDATLTEDIPGYVEGSSAYGLEGDRLPYSARNSFSGSVDHYFPAWGGLEGFVGLDVAYRGDRYMPFTTSKDLPRIHLSSYTTLGLNVGIQSFTWKATLYVRNLTDEIAYLNSNRRGSSASSILGPTLIQPRTIGLSWTWTP